MRVVRSVPSSEAVGQAGRCCGGVTKRGYDPDPKSGESEVLADRCANRPPSYLLPGALSLQG